MGRIFNFIFVLSLFIFSSLIQANDQQGVWITTGSDTIKTLQREIKSDLKIYEQMNGAVIMRIQEFELIRLSQIMHESFGRCGGFIVHDSIEEAREAIVNANGIFSEDKIFVDYTITEESTVESMMEILREDKIRETITKLSNFHNRYYKSENGVNSSKWLKEHWETMTKGRTDIKVEFFKHDKYPQTSIIVTVQGSDNPDEVIVVGGHADSIAGFWNRENAKAPGADDNASGIAVITEVIRAVVEKGYRPGRTVKFMAYAAEEVGLLGSADIAKNYQEKGIKVLGVLQLDMVNQKAGELDIVMMTDFTDKNQNSFLGKLVDHYVHVPWGYSKCGYGCSDHASWNKNGFSASIPFETKMELSNKNIHTANDTLQTMGGRADHALKFAKLSIAYMIEMAK